VSFVGNALGHAVNCAVSREALEDYFGANDGGRAARLEAFVTNRSKIEDLARAKFLPLESRFTGEVLLKSADVEKLRRANQPP